MRSTLLFGNDKWSVFSCACGCDMSVQITCYKLNTYNTDKFYVSGHGPTNAVCGPAYTFEAEPEKMSDISVNRVPDIVHVPTPLAIVDSDFGWSDEERITQPMGESAEADGWNTVYSTKRS